MRELADALERSSSQKREVESRLRVASEAGCFSTQAERFGSSSSYFSNDSVLNVAGRDQY